MLKEIKYFIAPLIPAPIRAILKRHLRRVAPSMAGHTAEEWRVAQEKQIRIRTEEELQLQARGLEEVKGIFLNLEIPYFISGGTLLGIIREGDFLPWDWDIGIDCKTEDILPNQQKLIEALEKAGFVIATRHLKQDNFKINAEKYGARYEIVGLTKIGRYRYRKAYRYPDSFVAKQSYITLRGGRYSTFQKSEDYLQWLYGDWRTPIRTTEKHSYVTSSSRTPLLAKIYLKSRSLISLT